MYLPICAFRNRISIIKAVDLLPQECDITWLDSHEDIGPNALYLLDGDMVPEEKWGGGNYIWAATHQFYQSLCVPSQLRQYPFLMFVKCGEQNASLMDAIICNVRNFERAWSESFESSPWGTLPGRKPAGYDIWLEHARKVAAQVENRDIRPELVPLKAHRVQSRQRGVGFTDNSMNDSLSYYDPHGDRRQAVKTVETWLNPVK